MEVRQCKECGNLFSYMGRPICGDCLEESDRKFLKVRDYLDKNPDANIAKIAEETEVPEKTILEFLKEERLSMQSMDDALACEHCGTMIQFGRFCEKCKDELEGLLTSRLPAQSPPKSASGHSSGRMHFKLQDKAIKNWGVKK